MQQFHRGPFILILGELDAYVKAFAPIDAERKKVYYPYREWSLTLPTAKRIKNRYKVTGRCIYGQRRNFETMGSGKQKYRIFWRRRGEYRDRLVSPPCGHQFNRGLIPVTFVPST